MQRKCIKNRQQIIAISFSRNSFIWKLHVVHKLSNRISAYKSTGSKESRPALNCPRNENKLYDTDSQ